MGEKAKEYNQKALNMYIRSSKKNHKIDSYHVLGFKFWLSVQNIFNGDVSIALTQLKVGKFWPYLYLISLSLSIIKL